ncbi:MAG: flagellar hook-basal body protein [Bryobacteraceae bacterium]
MDSLMISAASGMRARIESLEMLANNMANATSAGYKSDREAYNLYVSFEAIEAARMGLSPDATTAPVIERQWTDFSQGTLTPTGNPLDLALSGKGFFAVTGPQGPLYTRNGSFRLSAEGVLENQHGYPVRSATGEPGRPIVLDPALPVEVGPDGVVQQNGVVIDRIELVDFAGPEALAKREGVYFHAPDPQAAQPGPAAAQVQQGRLETANVGPAETAVRLVNVMRQFEMLHKAVTMAGEMNRRAVEEVAKVNP